MIGGSHSYLVKFLCTRGLHLETKGKPAGKDSRPCFVTKEKVTSKNLIDLKKFQIFFTLDFLEIYIHAGQLFLVPFLLYSYQREMRQLEGLPLQMSLRSQDFLG